MKDTCSHQRQALEGIEHRVVERVVVIDHDGHGRAPTVQHLRCSTAQTIERNAKCRRRLGEQRVVHSDHLFCFASEVAANSSQELKVNVRWHAAQFDISTRALFDIWRIPGSWCPWCDQTKCRCTLDGMHPEHALGK